MFYAQAIHSFDKGDMPEAVEAFAAAVGKKNELENPLAKRLLRIKLLRFNTQKDEIRRLKDELYALREIQKEYAREYYLIGNECITRAKDTQAALRNFDKALKLYPDFADAWVRKGVTLMDTGDYFTAQTCLNEALRLSPLSFKARYNRGKCHLLLKHYEEAVADMDKAVAIKKKHAAAHEYLAQAYRCLGNEEMARYHQNIADELRGNLT